MIHWLKIYGDFTGPAKSCLVVKLHQERSAAAACAVGLFFYAQELGLTETICYDISYFDQKNFFVSETNVQV